MSTKTIAVDSQVYARLAAHKREGESFSKLLDRLLTETAAAHTGGDVLRGLARISPLSPEDAGTFLKVVAENRKAERWERRDLR
jgi:predicted CopG family antitoxin